MREAKITVLFTRKLCGWGGDVDSDGVPCGLKAGETRDLAPCETVDALGGLTRAYRTDAHFVPYYVVDSEGVIQTTIPRLNKSCIPALRQEQSEVRLDLMVFDLDDEVAHAYNRKHHEDKDFVPMPARPEWTRTTVSGVDSLPWRASTSYYTTRGGMRLLMRLPEPLRPEHYEQVHAAFAQELLQRDIVPDPACKDWTRMYRLPWVCRDGASPAPDHMVLDNLNIPLDWPIPAFVAGQCKARRQPRMISTRRSGAVSPSGVRTIYARIARSGPKILTIPHEIIENRNDTLLSIGGTLREKGYGPAPLRAELERINRARVKPPLEAGELETVISSVERYRRER